MRIPSDEKYLNDTQFRQLVDSMLAMVSGLNISFAEIREACLFAQLKYEMSRPLQSIVLSPQLLEELRRRGLK